MSRVLLTLALAAAAVGHAAVPAPESYFGHRMGADRKLVAWERVVSYFEDLARSSDKIRVDMLGRTVEGRPFIAATIAAPATLRDLDRYRTIQEKLADPRKTPRSEAERLIDAGKTVVLITCSIHSTEAGSTHTAIEFAHRMVTAADNKTRAILDNVIFLLVPSLNPDGVEIMRRWYERTLDTAYEGTSPPELYHKYLGHDNNRDWYIFTQPETRLTISRLHNVWHPQIVYDVHQQGTKASRMFVPPWMDPIEPNIDPILAQLCNMIGLGMAADLTAAGKTGVVVNASYDFWTPARHYQSYHGGLRILSETASVKIATPITIKPEEIESSGRGYVPRERSWNHLEPWLGGTWTLRDIVDYQLISFESCLYQAAVRREDMLRAFYRIGERAVNRRTPYAYILPGVQPDPGSSRKLLETLSFGMVEIEQAEDGVEADGKQYAPGSYVIRMEQPYGNFAKTLLERQDYPDLRQYPGGPPKQPYDVTAHTLPLLMGVDVVVVEKPFQGKLRPAKIYEFSLSERPAASGGFSARDVDSWRKVNEAWKSGRPVYRDAGAGDFYPVRPAGVKTIKVKKPRIGLYRSFVPNMDEGWTRWLLEEFGFENRSVSNGEISRGEMSRRYDVLVFPDQSESTMANGYRHGTMPDEFTGGLDDRCAKSLRAFAEQGGTLVFLNAATEYAESRFGISVKNVVAGLRNSEFYSPGSLLNVRLEPHPLSYGLPAEIAIWSQASPAWDTGSVPGAVSIAGYPSGGILASGWLLGEKHLSGRSALVEAPIGKGRVILFGMRPQYRAQSYQAFKLFFNSLVRGE